MSTSGDAFTEEELLTGRHKQKSIPPQRYPSPPPQMVFQPSPAVDLEQHHILEERHLSDEPLRDSVGRMAVEYFNFNAKDADDSTKREEALDVMTRRELKRVLQL